MRHLTRPLIALALLALVVPLNTTHAQAPAGAKQRGEYGYYMGAGGSAMRSARDYTTYYRQYAQTAPAQKINPEIAKETADAIGDYITKAEKHFAWMRKQAQAGNDKETLTSLDAIDKNLADAKKHHANLCEYCAKDTVEAKGSMQCCQEIDAALAKAIAEHDKLMKKLAGQKK